MKLIKNERRASKNLKKNMTISTSNDNINIKTTSEYFNDKGDFQNIIHRFYGKGDIRKWNKY